jgi:DNA-binding PadR family transcriptional regulator
LIYTKELAVPDLQKLIPLRPVDLQILLVLANANLHGYGVLKAVREESSGRVALEVGSLYRVINRLLKSDLIEQVAPSAGSDDPRRKHDYAITEFGRSAVRAESERLAQVLPTAHARDLGGRA